MVQINTSGVKAAEKPPEEDPGEVEFFTYEGPKISFAASLGTSNAMSLYGFKAVTAINHKNSISWGPASIDGQGPGKLAIDIKGARKTVKMDLASKVEINPGGAFYKFKDWLAARGVAAEQDVAEDEQVDGKISTTVTEVENNGNQNSNSNEVTSNLLGMD